MIIKYLASQLYDSFIIVALFFAFTALCLIATQGQAIPPSTRWYQLALITIAASYYLFSIIHGGQTIGMRAWRLQLLSDTHTPNWRQALSRLILILPALLCGTARLTNPQRLLYRWTGTRLTVLPKSA
ncbi:MULTISPECIES: RDD family protein [unclassified Legionella]|uniref:RDD family protein n=1 Tax=unclassified Legionella TaxID=2622702 RepID=UPI0010555142|nr:MULTISPECIES: RDD family protein [unclassified Legionella]MDI9819177.1 RDD family protein [Legionella sp. PL877]